MNNSIGDLIGEDELAVMLGVPPTEVRLLAEAKKLEVIEGPDGLRRYARESHISMRQKYFRFRFRVGPPGDLFSIAPGTFGNLAVVAESSVSAIVPGRDTFLPTLSPIHGRPFWIHHLYAKDIGRPGSPIYNPVAGFESERGLEFLSWERLPKLRDRNLGIGWGDSRSVARESRTYFIAESQVLRSIRELWRHPQNHCWTTEAMYAVVPDSLVSNGDP